MSKQEEIQACLNCKFSTCQGEDSCPALQVAKAQKTVKISLLVDLLRAGYDPAEILFSAVEGGVPV